MNKKICSFNLNNKDFNTIKTLEKIFRHHTRVLLMLSDPKINPETVKNIFLEHFNAQLSSIPQNTEKLLLLFLYHSLKSVLNCSDVVIYQTEFDQIFGETLDEYLWVNTLFADPHHSSRFDVKIINHIKGDKQIELLNVYLIEGSEEFAFEKCIVPIKLENGILFAEVAEIKDKDGNIVKTKMVELSGISDPVSVRLPKTSQKAKKFLEFNNNNSPFAIKKDKNGKIKVIFYQESVTDIAASKRMLHSVYIQTLIELLKARKEEHLIPQILNFLFHEGIMIEVHREQEFKDIAGLNIIAMAHNVNHYIELIIDALRKGEKLIIQNNNILLNGVPIPLLNHNPLILNARIETALNIIKIIQKTIKKIKLDKIIEQAKEFEMEKENIVQREQERLKIAPLHELHVTYFEPIPLHQVLSHIDKDILPSFLKYIKENNIILETIEGDFLNLKTLGKRSQLLFGFFKGRAPETLIKLTQPKLKGKVICQPFLSKDGKTIQTKVLIIFNKPIHKNPEELFNPLFIYDELSSEKTLVDPRFKELKEYSPSRIPSFNKSDDGTVLEWVIDYDIWSYPERKILFRFCEGIQNTIEYNDGKSTKKATDIANILLSGHTITTSRNNENLIMEFFEEIIKTRRYDSEIDKNIGSKNSSNILANCINNKNFQKLVLSYFIRNHIDDLMAIKLEPIFSKILFRYLILNKDDAVYALNQIKGYKDITKIQNNPFVKSIELFLLNSI